MKSCRITELTVTYEPQVNCTLTQDMVMCGADRGGEVKADVCVYVCVCV